jgi:hypothetical protein
MEFIPYKVPGIFLHYLIYSISYLNIPMFFSHEKRNNSRGANHVAGKQELGPEYYRGMTALAGNMLFAYTG